MVVQDPKPRLRNAFKIQILVSFSAYESLAIQPFALAEAS